MRLSGDGELTGPTVMEITEQEGGGEAEEIPRAERRTRKKEENGCNSGSRSRRVHHRQAPWPLVEDLSLKEGNEKQNN